MDAEHDDDSRVDIEGVCERCRGIVWDGSKALQYIKVDGSEHRTSHIDPFIENCRICRFLARVIPIPSHSRKSFYKLEWWGNDKAPLRPRLGAAYVGSVSIESNRFLPPCEHWGKIIVSCLDLTAAPSIIRDLTPSEAPMFRVRNWINTCETRHVSQCTLDEYPHLSELRVIDCERELVIDAPANCKFVALSYVWGDQSTQSGAKDARSMQDQPRTIQQSISVTRDLGYKYLWVDRCCIAQEDVEDKARQISQMASIYKAAQLTIIAAAGTDSTHGLPGVRPHLRPVQEMYHENIGSFCLSALPAMRSLANVVDSKWASRAWTFQEGFSSRRRLIFTDQQVIFVCNTDVFYEFPIYSKEVERHERRHLQGWIPPRHEKTELSWDEQDYPLEEIMRSLREYSGRDLTHDYDALRAIEGTLNMLLEESENHLWGVPYRFLDSISPAGSLSQSVAIHSTENHLAETNQRVEICLLWSHMLPCRRRPGFPSWSPLGWAGEQKIDWPEGGTYTGVISLHTPEGPKALSKRKNCYDVGPTSPPKILEIIAKTTDARVKSEARVNSRYVVLAVSEELEVRVYEYWDDDSLELDDSLKAMIFDDGFILLKPQDDHYVRVGFCLEIPWDLSDCLLGRMLYEKDSSSCMEMPLSDQQQAQYDACRQGYDQGKWRDSLREELIVLA